MRIALGVSYNGQAYNGWQSQPSGNTVQDHLEAALGRFATHEIATTCAGRTDAGVHGLMQVVHFDTELQRAPFSWVRGTNTFLPRDIAVQWAQPVPDEFHSRAVAVGRRYAYVLLQSPVRPSVDAGRVGWVFHALDGAAMERAASYLLGEHDFTSFRASACQAKSPIKTLRRIDITRRGPQPGLVEDERNSPLHFTPCYWRFEFEANAFLHHMIRNLMGCLIMVGQGLKPPEWMLEVLAARSRDAAAPTFSPDGLYFLGPVYEDKWGLPSRTAAYDWLP
ncbi:tRNA pseudouridine synthase A [bioreactor metagenome]|uniref:tRNA pseudouridine synthase A n=1 Tax=bioreactor metagenome TaxID=1076179 RepID=A0A645CHY1_9ZZZZ